MSKRARHQPGFYASLFDDISDRGLSHKYRPKQKPVVMGIYEVERIVSKRNQGSNVENPLHVSTASASLRYQREKEYRDILPSISFRSLWFSVISSSSFCLSFSMISSGNCGRFANDSFANVSGRFANVVSRLANVLLVNSPTMKTDAI